MVAFLVAAAALVVALAAFFVALAAFFGAAFVVAALVVAVLVVLAAFFGAAALVVAFLVTFFVAAVFVVAFFVVAFFGMDPSPWVIGWKQARGIRAFPRGSRISNENERGVIVTIRCIDGKIEIASLLSVIERCRHSTMK